MKQLAVVSGKGGTGKTTVAAALGRLSGGAVMADCDVEAPNLHLVLPHTPLAEEAFFGNRVASIDRAACLGCSSCEDACRFGALRHKGRIVWVDERTCEGCGACTYACPHDAIAMEPRRTGTVLLARAEGGAFAHAALDIAADGSGKLVTEVRRSAAVQARQDGQGLVIIDGAPGTGCAVIATITGSDLILAVTEPTRSGWHDLERLLDVAGHFGIPALVVVNRWDIEPDLTRGIEAASRGRGAEIAGRIPFDPAVGRAMAEGLPVTALGGQAAAAIEEIWERLRARLEQLPGDGRRPLTLRREGG